MRFRSLRVVLVIVFLVFNFGCGRPMASDSAKAPPEPQTPGIISQPSVSSEPATPGNQGAGEIQPSDLTQRLLALPSPTIQPLYRWIQPPKEKWYRPLPKGILLVWTETIPSPVDDRPFIISAQGSNDQTLWSRQLEKPAREVRYVDISPSGDRLAVVERSGDVHVLSTLDGKTIATVHVRLDDPISDSVHLIADGQYLAVKKHTLSGVVPWTLAVYQIKEGNQSTGVYSTEGIAVHFSAYHDLLLGLQLVEQKGIEVATASGKVGFIPYPDARQGFDVDLDSSADGQLIYVISGTKGLDVYGRELKHLYHVDTASSLSVHLSPVAKMIWSLVSDGRFELIDASGKITSVTYDKQKISPGISFPGGEHVFQVASNGQKTECLVMSNGQVVGCFPFVGGGTETVGGHTFFWVILSDGTIAAYKAP